MYILTSDIPGEFRLRKLSIPYYNPYKRVTETGTLIVEPGVQIKSVNSEITVSGKIKGAWNKDQSHHFRHVLQHLLLAGHQYNCQRN
ncbi:MAG: hypothetical protein U0Z17_01475 [Bacteroidales bacterium]